MKRCALLFLLLAAWLGQAAAALAQPNIVIVNIDDFGWGDLGSYGGDYAQTPNLDQFAAQGMRFTQFYSGAPICSPSRAALFTGQYAARSGINTFLNNSASNLERDNANSLSLSAPSMARAFRDGGYATGHFGKWHLGGGRDVGYATSPTPGTNVAAPRVVEYGYDEAWTQFEGLGNRIINVDPYGGDAQGVTTRPSAYFNGLNQQSAARGTGGGLDQLVYLERQYNATFMIDRAIEFLDQSKSADPGKPVFMNVWLDESHTPHDPPTEFTAKYNNLYPDLPAQTRGYLAVVEYADQQIGRLIDHIDQQGLGEETLILVMADNGPTGANADNINSNGPFRGSKGDMFEGGMREPLLARWTGGVAAGVDTDTVIWGPDLFPTLLDVAGVAAPAGVSFDGENLGDALRGIQPQTRSTPLFWNMNRGSEGPHSNPDPAGAGANGQEAFAIRSGDWKLLLNADGTAPELYDLGSDQNESNNLAAQQPAVVQQLASEGLAIRYSTPSRTLPDTAAPTVRLKAEDLAGAGNGAAVANWSDSATGDSFNGNLSQPAAGNRPTLQTGALNGKAVVNFDGDDVLQSTTTNALPAPGQGITVFAVATGDTSGATAQRLGQLGASSGDAGRVVGLDASSTPTSVANGGAGFRYNNGASLHETPLTDPGFHIVVWQVDDGQAYADAKLLVDGTLPANTFTGDGSGASSMDFSGNDLELLLGTGRSASGGLLPSDHFSGQLAEFLVYNEQLTTGQINLVANYLSSEYGLPFAYETTLNLFAPDDGLAWTGGTANFDAAWNAGDGSGLPAGGNSDPFGGGQDLFLGNGGVATFDNSTDTAAGSSVNSLRIGTAQAGLIVAGTEGNGTLAASGSKSLTIGNGAPPTGGGETGDLTIGEEGYSGAVHWASTGTLNVEGRLRIGQGGVGVFNQDAGIVSAGAVDGRIKFLAVGSGAGSEGTYNLNSGRLLPGGGIGGAELRQLRIGYDGSVGVMNVGDGAGAAGTARIESPDDIFVGQDGGDGTLVINSDGAVQLAGASAELHVAHNGGATGRVVQNGGVVSTESQFTIGVGGSSVGEYQLNAGSLTASGVVQVGAGGGQGTLRVSGSASFSSSNDLVLGHGDDSGAEGLLELVGGEASFQIARLDNALANDESIRWVAGASGVTPIGVIGSGGTERVQLQNPAELLANTGANGGGNLRGDGIALSLDLAAVSGSGALTLIDNQSTHSVTGFFEDASTGDLYEEGEQILDTGYRGGVTISYVGGTGNDVVLQLVASPLASADFDSDGDVDGGDFLAWQRGLGAAGPTRSTGDANADGVVDGADLQVWTDQFGQPAAEESRATTVPEPQALALAFIALLVCYRLRMS